MHVVEVKVPVALDENETVPVGTIPPVPEASETVAVQTEFVFVFTLAGEHETDVEDALIVDASVNVPLLPVWTLFPP